MTPQCCHFRFSEILLMKFGINKHSSPTKLHIAPDYYLNLWDFPVNKQRKKPNGMIYHEFQKAFRVQKFTD